MSEVIKLVPRSSDQPYLDDSAAVLREAMDAKLHSVIVFGLNGDGKLMIRSAANRNTLEVMGALEAAKAHLWGAP